jgi:uncharacterized DUF497 family protein
MKRLLPTSANTAFPFSQSACEAFFDPFLQAPDEDNEFINGELREKVVGMSAKWQLIYVVYVLRDDRIRIISARPTTPFERNYYENA